MGTSYEPKEEDRRPIATRDRKASHAVARCFVRRGVSPNAISVTGMIAGILAGLAFAATNLRPELEPFCWLAAAACMQLRRGANMFDGMVALESGKASQVGELYNEIPDRISDTAALVGAGFAVGGNLHLGYLAAVTAVFVAYVRVQGKAGGAPNDFCGPMAKPHRMFLMTLVAIFCAVAPATWYTGWDNDWLPGLSAVGLLVIVVGGLFAAMRKLWRIACKLKQLH